MTAAVALDSLTARIVLTVLEQLAGYVGLGLLNAAGWLGAAYVLTWPGALLAALLGVLLTTLLLPDPIQRRPRRAPGGFVGPLACA